MTVYRAADLDGARRAVRGELLGDEVSTGAREVAVRVLHAHGRTDAEIAARLRLSTYTAARIRARLRLRAHPPLVRTPDRGVDRGA